MTPPNRPRRARRSTAATPDQRLADARRWYRAPANEEAAAAALLDWARNAPDGLPPDAAALADRLRADAVAPDAFLAHADRRPPPFVLAAIGSVARFALRLPDGPLLLADGEWAPAPETKARPGSALHPNMAFDAQRGGRLWTVGGEDPATLRLFFDGREWIPTDAPRPFRWLYRLAGKTLLPDGLPVAVAAFEARRRAPKRRDLAILPALAFRAPHAVQSFHEDRERGIVSALPDAPGFDRSGRDGLFGPLLPDTPLPAVLELADRSGIPTMARGRGAPLPLRLVVESYQSVELDEARRAPVRIALTVRELAAWLFPRLGRMANPRSDWPRLRAALDHLGRCGFPWLTDGQVTRWRPLHAEAFPDSPTPPPDHALIVLAVGLPPGTGPGPVIPRHRLREVGADSAPKYRSLIAVHSLAYQLGRTRTPASGRFPETWRGDRSAYPVLDAALRRRVAFGALDRKHRTAAAVDAPILDLADDRDAVILDRRAVEPDTRRRGWIVLPPMAAAAVRKKESDG